MQRRAAYGNSAIWALCFGVGTVVWLLNAGSEIIDVLTGDQDFPLWEPVVWEMTSTLAMVLLAPFVIEFALRFRFSTVGRPRGFAAHLLAMVLFSLAHVAIMVGMRQGIYAAAGDEYRFGHLGLELLYEGFKDYISYGLIVGLTYGFDYYRRYREREVQTAQLAAGLARAQLENLEHRIQPHFLFNTLNMISATMHEDVEVADRMIARLSDLLRMSVDRRGRQEVRLGQEIAMLEAYLDIMRTRFEQRLVVDVEADEDTAGALVPPLLLQPLVENAIKYGVAERDTDGRIDVRISRGGSRLLLSVRDDGPGSDDAGPALLDRGLGLSTTAERLKRLYGDDHAFEITRDAGGGLLLSIAIPYRTSPVEGAADGVPGGALS